MNKKSNFSLYILIIVVIVSFFTNSCKKDEGVTNIIKQKITGQVQKGPYINGTAISMSELSASLDQTGKIFTTQISNNKGSFEINNVNLSSSYVEFAANGYYFDEVKGYLSPAPLALFALSDITDISTVNVNILTHLEKLRVEYLVKQNKTFSEAKKTAQSEILAIFGFSLNKMDASETLDISVNTEENAILLAVSIILQGNRSVGDLTELLANLMNDISEDGILNNESILTDLNKSAKESDLAGIRSNLEKRYLVLGISASIPDFEKYVNNFLVFTSNYRENSTLPASNITESGVTLNGSVNARSSNTVVSFEYGTGLNYGSTVSAIQSPLNGNSFINVNAGITGLLPSTVYHFRVKAVNVSGTTYGQDENFTTLNLPGAPSLTTNPVTDITKNSATCGGNINSDGGSPVKARGICWSTSPNPRISDSVTKDGTGSGEFTSSIKGLTPGTTYYIKSYATNNTGSSYGEQITFTTLISIDPCPGIETITIYHVAGDVAPVSKTVTYNTVTNIPGEPSKCWISSNLGADHQATAVDDASEASAGWYWQFNRKQGFKHDGLTLTPNTWITSSIYENLNWVAANDPCTIELGNGWRIPTSTEWSNVIVAGNWQTDNGPWKSALKIHDSGHYNQELYLRGSAGNEWSSTQSSSDGGYYLNMYGNSSVITTNKMVGFTLRCIKDIGK